MYQNQPNLAKIAPEGREQKSGRKYFSFLKTKKLLVRRIFGSKFTTIIKLSITLRIVRKILGPSGEYLEPFRIVRRILKPSRECFEPFRIARRILGPSGECLESFRTVRRILELSGEF